MDFESSSDAESRLGCIVWIIYLVAYFFYFVGCERSTGKTIGKYVTGTKVVTVDAGQPSIRQLIGRTAARFVPFEPFSFFGDKQPVGWHDDWSGTRVVKDRR